MGNTGNARTTPPHLHFGIYQRRRGAVDPFPFVDQPQIIPPSLVATDSGMLRWYRINQTTSLVSAPSAKAELVRGGTSLEPETPVMRLAASGKWHRVQLPDGTQGFVLHTATQPTLRALKSIRLTQQQVLLDQVRGGIILDSLAAGSKVELLAQTASHQYVRTEAGQVGYLTRSLDAIPQSQ